MYSILIAICNRLVQKWKPVFIYSDSRGGGYWLNKIDSLCKEENGNIDGLLHDNNTSGKFCAKWGYFIARLLLKSLIRKKVGSYFHEKSVKITLYYKFMMSSSDDRDLRVPCSAFGEIFSNTEQWTRRVKTWEEPENNLL